MILLSCKTNRSLDDKNQINEQETTGITFSVMAWNIWHGANDEFLIEDGRPNAIRIIKAFNPDIILMVETYGSGKMIADSLGYNFHLIAPEETPLDDKSTNLSIFSKFPFGERIDFYNPFNIGGIEIFLNDSTKINAFTIWMNYRPWIDDPMDLDMSTTELIDWEKSGTRLKETQTILEGLNPYIESTDETPIILGGDFNIWSHLDWEENTKHIHEGRIVNWFTTSSFAEAGFIDSYRFVNPNPVSHPGITWDQPEKKDEHRIDYIFYQGENMKATKSIIRKEAVNQFLKIKNDSVLFPSDHGFVYTAFEIN